MSRVAGALYLCGALLVGLSLLLVHPESADTTAMLILIAIATATGVALIALARHVPVLLLQLTGLVASTCTALCVVFAGVASGIYPGMFLWIVLYNACFFPGWRAFAQLGWILVNYGVVLAVVESSAGFSPVTRFLSTAFVLGVACVTVSWLVSSRRESMRELEAEVAKRKELERQLQDLADTDHLTGLSNRRRLERDSARELRIARRYGRPVTVAMIDIDGFKELNDTAGHAEGDELLKAVAETWQVILRKEDLLARIGGDEFVVVLSGCAEDEATVVLDRLRRMMPPGQTCSIGIAQVRGDEPFDGVLARADRALYGAKRAGRDRVLAGV
jgi:diguanylate cyclase (GGDEF)-like protein